MTTTRDSLRKVVLAWFASRGEKGGTDDEAQKELDLAHQVETPRRWELSKAELVRDTGRTRPTRLGGKAIVWVATDKLYESVDWELLDQTIRPVVYLREENARLLKENAQLRAEIERLQAK